MSTHRPDAYELTMETRDRVRRIETRLTRFLHDQGFDTQVQRPHFDGDAVHIPSPSVALDALLEAIPPGHTHDAIPVLLKGQVKCYICPTPTP